MASNDYIVPGVYIEESDASNYFRASVSFSLSYAGIFKKGPIGSVVNILDEFYLKDTFGDGNTKLSQDPNLTYDWHAAKYLANSTNNLNLVRTIHPFDGTVGDKSAFFNSGSMQARDGKVITINGNYALTKDNTEVSCIVNAPDSAFVELDNSAGSLKQNMFGNIVIADPINNDVTVNVSITNSNNTTTSYTHKINRFQVLATAVSDLNTAMPGVTFSVDGGGFLKVEHDEDINQFTALNVSETVDGGDVNIFLDGTEVQPPVLNDFLVGVTIDNDNSFTYVHNPLSVTDTVDNINSAWSMAGGYGLVASATGTVYRLTSPTSGTNSQVDVNLPATSGLALVNDKDTSTTYEDSAFTGVLPKPSTNPSDGSDLTGTIITADVNFISSYIYGDKTKIIVDVPTGTVILNTYILGLVYKGNITDYLTYEDIGIEKDYLIDSSAALGVELANARVFSPDFSGSNANVVNWESDTVLKLDDKIFSNYGDSYKIASSSVTVATVTTYFNPVAIEEVLDSAYLQYSDASDSVGGVNYDFGSFVDGYGNVSKVYNSLDDNFKDTIIPPVGFDGLSVFAKSPGSWGNNISVYMLGSNYMNSAAADSFARLFDYKTFKPRELAIIIQNAGDNTTETYMVSLDEDAKDDMNQFYYIEDTVNNNSSNISIFDLTSSTFNAATYAVKFTLQDGLDSTVHNNDDLKNAYSLFKEEGLSTPVIVSGRTTHTSPELDELNQFIANTVIDAKVDVFLLANVPLSVVRSANTAQSISNWGSLGFKINNNQDKVSVFPTYFYVINEYTNKKILLPSNVLVARNFATALSGNANRENAIMGSNRGVVGGFDSYLWLPKNKTEEALLYTKNVNPIKRNKNGVVVINGQKTRLKTGSTFNRTNVRLLFNELEILCQLTVENQDVVNNTSIARNDMASIVSNVLDLYKTERGAEFTHTVICDSTNNTENVIRSNQMVVDIAIKAPLTAEVVILKFKNDGAVI